MKGFRFYAELPENRGSKAANKRYRAFNRQYLESVARDGMHVNCIAVMHANGQNDVGDWDSFAPVSDRANAPVEAASVQGDYLRRRCVRISSDLALKLHPNLARRLAD